MSRLVFELPLPKNIGNRQGRNWMTRHGTRKDYYTLLDTLVTVKRNPRCVPGMPWMKAEAEVQMRTFRAMDEGNAHSRTKWIFDWLQSRGYIKNDKHLAYKLDAVTACKDDLGVTIVLREAL